MMRFQQSMNLLSQRQGVKMSQANKSEQLVSAWKALNNTATQLSKEVGSYNEYELLELFSLLMRWVEGFRMNQEYLSEEGMARRMDWLREKLEMHLEDIRAMEPDPSSSEESDLTKEVRAQLNNLLPNDPTK